MARTRPENFLTVKVAPPIPVLKGKLQNWQYRDVKSITEKVYNEMLNDAVKIMKQFAPARSGQLKRSIKIRFSKC